MGDHKHAVGDFAVAGAGEEDHDVQVVAYGAVHRHTEGVDGVFGGQDSDKQALPHAKLRAYVLSPEKQGGERMDQYSCLIVWLIDLFIYSMSHHNISKRFNILNNLTENV